MQKNRKRNQGIASFQIKGEKMNERKKIKLTLQCVPSNVIYVEPPCCDE